MTGVTRDEGFSDLPALLRADGNVLQVWVLGVEPSSGGDRLVVCGVDTTGLGPDGCGQRISIGRFQLGGGAKIKEALDDLVFRGKFDKRLLVGGILSRFGLLWLLGNFQN